MARSRWVRESPPVGNASFPGYAYDVAVSGNYAYVLDGSGLRVIDITDPQSPYPVGWAGTMGSEPASVAVADGVAYVGEQNPGYLEVFDLTNPTAPRFLGERLMPWACAQVVLGTAHLYVLGELIGFHVLPLQCDPARVFSSESISPRLLLNASPNPMTNQTAISLNTPRSGLVRVSVFDSSGRLISRLLNAHLGAGVHTLSWDGRDDEGRRVASGVYQICSVAGKESVSGRVVVIR
jgi:hypothetical protein